MTQRAHWHRCRRGMLQRIRAAIDAEVAPMVGSVLLRHAL
jgi:hypothetical protein